MKKNIIIPVTIIFLGLAVGVFVLGQRIGGRDAPVELVGANLRQLELSVPGMFCAGCTASVENYVAATPGVKRVEARLTPSRSATVVYDPDQTDAPAITANEIFDVYGVEIVEDVAFSGGLNLQPATGPGVPPEIQQKAAQVAELLRQKEEDGLDTSNDRSFLQQVNRLIERGAYAEAGNILDLILL